MKGREPRLIFGKEVVDAIGVRVHLGVQRAQGSREGLDNGVWVAIVGDVGSGAVDLRNSGLATHAQPASCRHDILNCRAVVGERSHGRQQTEANHQNQDSEGTFS